MMVESFPETASVPWARTRRPIPHSLVSDLVRQAWIFASNRIRRLLSAEVPETSYPSSESLEGYASDLILDALPGDVFDLGATQRLCRAGLNGSGSPTPLYLLSTLAECVRLFGIGGVTQIPPEARPVL